MALGKAVMLVGPAGTGKTQLIMGVLRDLVGEHGCDYVTTKINMNFYTRYVMRAHTVSFVLFSSI